MTILITIACAALLAITAYLLTDLVLMFLTLRDPKPEEEQAEPPGIA